MARFISLSLPRISDWRLGCIRGASLAHGIGLRSNRDIGSLPPVVIAVSQGPGSPFFLQPNVGRLGSCARQPLRRAGHRLAPRPPKGRTLTRGGEGVAFDPAATPWTSDPPPPSSTKAQHRPPFSSIGPWPDPASGNCSARRISGKSRRRKGWASTWKKRSSIGPQLRKRRTAPR